MTTWEEYWGHLDGTSFGWPPYASIIEHHSRLSAIDYVLLNRLENHGMAVYPMLLLNLRTKNFWDTYFAKAEHGNPLNQIPLHMVCAAHYGANSVMIQGEN